MEYKTSESHRKASQKYRKTNKEAERVNTYRRTSKAFLTKHAKFHELLDSQRYIFGRVNEIIDSPEYSDEDKEELEKMYRNVLDEYKRRGWKE